MTLNLNQITKISVFNDTDYDEIPKDELAIDENKISFKLWSNLELIDYPVVYEHPSGKWKSTEIESIEGLVLNEVTLTFDLDTCDLDDWMFETKVTALEVNINSCSDECVLEYFKDELEESILDEILNGIEIQQEELDVKVE